MKIAILVEFFPPHWLAGTELASYNIAKNLALRGHDVHVITSWDEGLPKRSLQDGFHIHRAYRKKTRFFSQLFFLINIFFYLKSIQPDIIHVQKMSLVCLPAFFSKKILKKPYIIYMRGSDVYHISILWKKISKLILKNSVKVIVLTEDMKRELKKIYCGEILVIPNGIELDNYKNLRKQNSLVNNKKIIIFVGTLRPVKGLIYLIKAMDIIHAEIENTILMIIGDGEERKSLEEAVIKSHLEKVVIFNGKIPNKDIPKYLVQGDVFVLPSLSEGFPNVILEAMAAGLPIVSTNIHGLSEIIRNEENGYLVEPKNPQQLADKLLQILKNPIQSKKISSNNIEKVKKYSWKNVIECLEDVYLKVLI
jgi:glycosyltransferase involved in cell wall biosynthesis